MNIEKTLLDINGHSIHVEVSGVGKPLMLINGLGGDPAVLEGIRNHLPNYQTIIFDPPGVGQSSDLKFPIRMSSHANIAAGVLDKLNISSTSILGVSWGGALAQEITKIHPHKVDKLILVSTLSVPALIMRPTMFLERYIKMISSSKPDWLQIGSLIGWTSLGYLKKIPHHTLIISGLQDDLVLPYHAKILHWLLPNSKLQLIDGHNHWLIMDMAERLAGMVTDFLEGGTPTL